ncbi:hypothetical protein FJD33_20010 [Shewanella sp. LC2]|uniref:hypothetical protein n=1 Tax=Shewanella sp. LC2 TaxID=2589789 RepID=UPI001127CCBD|nr:hypothetical protein [Shewanella sp. LC2]TPE50633.1 hypothetical protein FJD33_20010 [Shewanella sp. LC2]
MKSVTILTISSCCSKFNVENLNNATRIICATYGVSEFQVLDELRDIFEFGLDKSRCSTERIINLWEDYCADQFLINCEELGIAA